MTIDRFEGEHRFLSNFAPSRIRWRGREWPTVEHAYQAAKNYDPRTGAPKDEAAVEEIRTASTSNRAKKLGRKIEMVPEWEKLHEGEPLKLAIMRELVRVKFQIPELRTKLLATGDQELVEGNWWGDRVWGVCKGEGANWLGKVLMNERNRIREENR